MATSRLQRLPGAARNAGTALQVGIHHLLVLPSSMSNLVNLVNLRSTRKGILQVANQRTAIAGSLLIGRNSQRRKHPLQRATTFHWSGMQMLAKAGSTRSIRSTVPDLQVKSQLFQRITSRRNPKQAPLHVEIPILQGTTRVPIPRNLNKTAPQMKIPVLQRRTMVPR